MSEYTIFEAIELLGKDNTLEFESDNGKISLYCNSGCVALEGDCIKWFMYANGKKFIIPFVAKWKLIEKPVSWQEAIQAMLDGQTIKHVWNEEVGDLSFFSGDERYFPIDIERFKYGKWYIVPKPTE